MTPLELFNVLSAGGARLSLGGSQQLRIDGPKRLVEQLNNEIDEHADALIAIAEEFGVDAAPVAAAESILRSLQQPRAHYSNRSNRRQHA